jgi:hypothetical protein
MRALPLPGKPNAGRAPKERIRPVYRDAAAPAQSGCAGQPSERVVQGVPKVSPTARIWNRCPASCAVTNFQRAWSTQRH